MKNQYVRAFVLTLAFAVSSNAQSGAKKLAVVNGDTITEDQVNSAAATELENLSLRQLQLQAGFAQDKHEILEKTLDALVQNKLFAMEAAKRGVSVDEFLKTEIESKVGAPPEDIVNQTYEANRAQLGAVSEEEGKQQVRLYLMDQRRRSIQETLLSELKKQYAVEILMEPRRVEVSSSGFPSTGSASAPITIVEFSDFECPFCARLFTTMKQVEEKHRANIRLVYRQFPLNSIHPRAQKAAEASLCANEQQRFWEFHDAMFSRPDALAVDQLKAKAAELKLDTTAFNACLDSGKQAQAVKQDVYEGIRSGVTGTPALFINGRMIAGAQPYDAIVAIIEDELKRLQKK